MKIPATENELNKLENNQPQIENLDYRANNIEIQEIKQNTMKELIEATNIDMKDKAPLKRKKL